MPGMAVIAKFLAYSSLASRVDAQSASLRAVTMLGVPLTMAVDSRSQPRPSCGNSTSIGAPLVRNTLARYSNAMPTGNSPAAAITQGLEPEWVYTAMLSCSLSM